MADIACLGILVADLVGRPIDTLPPVGRLGLVDEISLHIGGCASNTGIDLVRLGVSTTVLGKVGRDGLGDFVVQTLERESVDIRGLRRSAETLTSASMVLVNGEGERTFLHNMGGNACYREEEVDWDVLAGARILHMAGALVMPALDGEPMARVLDRARTNGMATSLDTVWDATGRWLGVLRPCLAKLDYIMPSLAEARQLTGLHEAADIAHFLHDEGVGTVCLKLGEDGCYVSDPSGSVQVPIYRVTAVDGTGSGDAWAAGFLLGAFRGWDIERSARFANAVGALCVSAVGATTGVRTYADTLDFMESTPLDGRGS